MAYMHIDNLYKFPDIFLFKEVYCLEKIHGTSAHIAWRDGEIRFFAGGEKHQKFVDLFDEALLRKAFESLGHTEVVVFGEAYGGKCQGMSDTYGLSLRFVAFEVKVGDTWLNVPNAHDVVTKLQLEFVDYVKCPATEEALTIERDKLSAQAIRNGIKGDKKREGIVLRPVVELKRSDGSRIIAKYKTENFQETRTPRPLDMDKLKVLEEANAIAGEWVTPMRLQHTGLVIRAMQEDVKREAGDEVKWSKDATRAVGKLAANLYKKHVQQIKV